MYQRKRKRLWTRRCFYKTTLTVVLGAVLVWILSKSFSATWNLPKNSRNSESPFCSIPKIPLHSVAYNRTVKSVPVISDCKTEKILLTKFLDNGTLELLSSDLYDREECTAFEILRPSILRSDTHVLRQLEPFDTFNQIHSIQAEYLMVACRDTWTETLQYSYHARLLTNNEPIRSPVEYWENERGQRLPVNVILMVLDSVSANDASRQLPMTMDFLKSKLDFAQFHKFHALGEPTMLNAMPLLTGASAETIFKHKRWTYPWDSNYFIWQDFQNANYVTGYMEDVPDVGTFDYLLQGGFLAPPTEIYPRPLFTAWELNKKQSDKCIGNSSLWKFILDYELEILHKLDQIVPTFTIPWLAWPFHDHFGTLSSLDTDLLKFFSNLTSTPSISENTVIIIMADHGFYADSYSNTHEGLLERRLPLFLIRIPEKLKEQLPHVSEIVAQNSERVTSHYDVYKTLFQLSQMAGVNPAVRNEKFRSAEDGPGQSLLEPIPKGRTCSDAQIPNGWCACNLAPPPAIPETVIDETVLLDVPSFHLNRFKDLIG